MANQDKTLSFYIKVPVEICVSCEFCQHQYKYDGEISVLQSGKEPVMYASRDELVSAAQKIRDGKYWLAGIKFSPCPKCNYNQSWVVRSIRTNGWSTAAKGFGMVVVGVPFFLFSTASPPPMGMVLALGLMLLSLAVVGIGLLALFGGILSALFVNANWRWRRKQGINQDSLPSPHDPLEIIFNQAFIDMQTGTDADLKDVFSERDLQRELEIISRQIG